MESSTGYNDNQPPILLLPPPPPPPPLTSRTVAGPVRRAHTDGHENRHHQNDHEAAHVAGLRLFGVGQCRFHVAQLRFQVVHARLQRGHPGGRPARVLVGRQTGGGRAAGHRLGVRGRRPRRMDERAHGGRGGDGEPEPEGWSTGLEHAANNLATAADGGQLSAGTVVGHFIYARCTIGKPTSSGAHGCVGVWAFFHEESCRRAAQRFCGVGDGGWGLAGMHMETFVVAGKSAIGGERVAVLRWGGRKFALGGGGGGGWVWSWLDGEHRNGIRIDRAMI